VATESSPSGCNEGAPWMYARDPGNSASPFAIESFIEGRKLLFRPSIETSWIVPGV